MPNFQTQGHWSDFGGTMENSLLEQWRKQIKNELRLDFIDISISVEYLHKENAIAIQIRYTEDDIRHKTDEKLRVHDIELARQNKNRFLRGIPWRELLKESIERHGKNRKRENMPSSFILDEEYKAAPLPCVQKIVQEQKKTPAKQETIHKVAIVPRQEEYREVRYKK